MSHVELPEAPEAGTTPFKRRLAILVGISAVVAALLATLEVDSGRRADRASVDGSRRAVAIFEQIADSGLDLTGAADVLRDEFSFANDAQQRVLRATGLLPLGIGAAQVEAAKSLDAQLAATIGTAISPAGALKLQQRQRAEAEAQNRAVARQNAAVAAAERYGHRRSRTVFALSVLASAGALFGLAGVLEAGRSASLVLATGAAALAVSIATGISALLL